MDISKNLKYNKDVLLSYFRNRSNEIKSELALRYSAADYKKKCGKYREEKAVIYK